MLSLRIKSVSPAGIIPWLTDMEVANTVFCCNFFFGSSILHPLWGAMSSHGLGVKLVIQSVLLGCHVLEGDSWIPDSQS